MDRMNQVFDRLDEWRCLPDYQLERRADLYFSLYLPEVLEAALRMPFQPVVIPEFPIKQVGSNRSDKVDYLAATAGGAKPVFVELKTDSHSTRTEQFEYLRRGAQKTGVELLEDLRTIRKASKALHKYDALIAATRELGLTANPTMEIGTNHPVVLISPHLEFNHRDKAIEMFKDADVPFHVITFEMFGATVRKHQDPLSIRFAESLDYWRKNTA